MTSYQGPTQGPQPGDVVIGMKVKCKTTSPGLDGHYDRVIRISYRPPGLPLPKDLPNPAPPSGRGAFGSLSKTALWLHQGGAEIDASGMVWIDTVAYGQPPAESVFTENLGDDSEDIASSIEESVTRGVLEHKIDRSHIQVQHNGQSDTDPNDPLGGPCPKGKPQNDVGRCRIILRNPSHWDAHCNDGKIEMVVIEIPRKPDGGGAPPSGAIEIRPIEPLPPWMPSVRRKEPVEELDPEWIKTKEGPQKSTPRKTLKPTDKEALPYLREDLPWETPPMRNRRWWKWPDKKDKKHAALEPSAPFLSPPATYDADTEILEVGFLTQGFLELVQVPIHHDLERQISVLREALEILGCFVEQDGVWLRYQRSCFSPDWGSFGLYIRARGFPWHIVVERDFAARGWFGREAIPYVMPRPNYKMGAVPQTPLPINVTLGSWPLQDHGEG